MLVTSGFANFVSHLNSAMTRKADEIMMEHFYVLRNSAKLSIR